MRYRFRIVKRNGRWRVDYFKSNGDGFLLWRSSYYRDTWDEAVGDVKAWMWVYGR